MADISKWVDTTLYKRVENTFQTVASSRNPGIVGAKKADKEPFSTAHGRMRATTGGGGGGARLPRFTRRTDAPTPRAWRQLGSGHPRAETCAGALHTAMGFMSRLLALDDALGRLGDNIARWVLFSEYLHVLTSEPPQLFLLLYCGVKYLKMLKVISLYILYLLTAWYCNYVDFYLFL